MSRARRCPVCERTMEAAVCPDDRMATLLVDLPVHDAPPPAVGEVLVDRYEVREPIGAGGYGRVYRARHLGTGQNVAIKVLRVPPDEDGTFAVQRFFLEARATSGLTHPNTVRVFDFGQDDAGRVFLAMELLAGRTLREELRVRKARGQRFSDAEVVQIGVGVCRSLSEAHEHGLVHRDLKPDNIFLHRVAGDDPVVKVLDFGIAKLGKTSRHTLSSDTSVPGTPAYMAPEHAFNLAVDGRTDLYALGVVLYQLLTLELPYQAPSDPQTLYMHAYEAVPDPRARADVADGLAQVVMRAMQKKPEARFSDARQMRASLAGDAGQVAAPELFAAPAPVEAGRATTGEVAALRATREVAFDEGVSVRASSWSRFVPGALGAIVVAGIALWWFAGSARAPAEPSAPASASVAPAVVRPEAAEAVEPAARTEPEASTDEVAAPAVPDAGVALAPARSAAKRRPKRTSRRRRRPAVAPTKVAPMEAPPEAVPTSPETDNGQDVLQMRVEELIER